MVETKRKGRTRRRKKRKKRRRRRKKRRAIARGTNPESARSRGYAPVHHLGPTVPLGPVWHLAAGRFAATTIATVSGRKKGREEGREEARRKGESGTQEAPETGCGQLFTSWRMIPR